MGSNRKFALLTIWLLLLTSLYFISWSYTYDTATPAGSDDPAEADDRMREIKAALQERLNVEHVFDLTGTEVSDANTGKHTDITCDSIVNAGSYSGTTITTSSTLDVAGNIDPTTYETTNGGFLDEDDMASDANDKVASQQSIKKYVDDQIAGADPAYSGGESHTFGGGLIIKMGEVVVAGNSTGTVDYADFPNAVISVSATLKTTDKALNGYASAVASTANIQVSNDNSLERTVYWIAIGY